MTAEDGTEWDQPKKGHMGCMQTPKSNGQSCPNLLKVTTHFR